MGDTAWAKNPFDRINEAGMHDLFVTRDGGSSWCGCFLFFRSTPGSKHFTQSWLGQTQTDWYGNQMSLTRVIDNSIHAAKPAVKCDVKVLERKDFPSAHAVYDHKYTDVTVYHANWMRQPEMKKK